MADTVTCGKAIAADVLIRSGMDQLSQGDFGGKLWTVTRKHNVMELWLSTVDVCAFKFKSP
jgi:hypothetical protein